MTTQLPLDEHGQHSPDVPAHFLHSPTAQDAPRLPQIISHRGYKGKFPENTLGAIEGAIEAGTQALEIDLHLTRDEVLVLSHDPTLERCFGVKSRIADCDWEYLKTLRTLKAPNEPMARLVDVLEYLRQPGREHVWVFLDIKVTNDPATILRRIAETIQTVPVLAIGPDWHRRIVLGCWSALFVPQCARYLPRYPVTLSCFDFKYARKFLPARGVSFNANYLVLMGPLGRGFLEEARAARRQVYLWTVNTPSAMRWAIRHQVDGVITDDPVLCRQVCAEWEKEKTVAGSAGLQNPEPVPPFTWAELLQIFIATMRVLLFGWLLKRRFLLVEPVQFEEHKVD